MLMLELGLGEKHIHEKYLGTIFTKQQTGFNPDAETLKAMSSDKKAKTDSSEMEDNPNLTLLCGYNEFDSSIKFGRDN